ncbi:helix-turn-helix transcriptional regulator [Lapidilactobacillus achengensis]|uniref:Helix-turn-helix transcriptional regulator n=1 Tax=Lapidilactobacillus achengensis TaxID=2486000 RepID=A0ABW1UL38_9LACO|nr:helix-turn-helix transcriptional regulator [Lapidilactobacillus achengensis]
MSRPKLHLQNRLKQARGAAGLTQSALAKLVGVSRQTISNIETNQFVPSARLALLLCLALNQDFADLFYFDDPDQVQRDH